MNEPPPKLGDKTALASRLMPRLIPGVVGIFYALLLLALFGPGGMTVDSFSHWHQGATLVFDNWHPPLTALLMRAAQAMGASSPWPVLLAQGALLGAGVFVFLRDATKARSLAVLGTSLVVLLTPPVLLHAHMMWKDTWCAVTFVWAAVYARRALSEPTPRTWIGLLAWCVATAALRHNAVLLVVMLLTPLFFRAARARQVRQIGIVVALGAAALGTPRVLEGVTHARDLAPVQQILVHDFAGVEQCNGFADWQAIEALTLVPREALAQGYTVNEIVPLFDGGRPYRTVNLYEAAPYVSAMREVWWQIVPKNLGCYLRHRTAVFARLVGADGGPTCYPYETHVGVNGNGIAAFGWVPRATAFVDWLGDVLKDTVLFRLWFYIVLGATLFVWFARRKDVSLAACLAAALAYQLAYFFVATTCDFRLGFVLVVAVWLATLVWMSHLRQDRRQS